MEKTKKHSKWLYRLGYGLTGCLVVVSISLLLLGQSSALGQSSCNIVGTEHGTDEITVEVCTLAGCRTEQQIVPCRHPILNCR